MVRSSAGATSDTLSPLAKSLSSYQLSQITSYLAQNLDISGMPSSSGATAMSVGQITDLNCYVLFGPSSCVVQDHTGKKIGAGRKVNGLNQLEYLHLPLSRRLGLSLFATYDVWHHCLSNSSEARLQTLLNSG